MTLYEKFKKLNLETSYIGLIRDYDCEGYFCTPKGAVIIGKEGVDGIHYCFVRNYGEIVFAVNPMGTYGEYVYPLAYTFEDFLSLILACKSACAVEQIYGMNSRNEFIEFLDKQSLCYEQTEVLSIVRNKLDVRPMEDPYKYVKKVQAETDLSGLRFSKEYYKKLDFEIPEDVEWKAYMSGSFFGHDEHERAGREIRVDKRFEYAGREWLIPSVYICREGIVVDVCYAIESDKLRRYMDEIDSESEENSISSDNAAENPFDFGFAFDVSVNGEELSVYEENCGCTGVSYNPLYPETEYDGLIGLNAVEHYNLEKNKAWVFLRSSFAWNMESAPNEIKNIGVNIECDKIPIPVLEFSKSDKGRKFEFESPADGEKYCLKLLDIRRFDLSDDICKDIGIAFPSSVEEVIYKLIPDIQFELSSVCLCDDSESIISGNSKVNTEDDSVRNRAVIGGDDGPIAFFFTFEDDDNSDGGYDDSVCRSQTICKPDDKVKWILSAFKSPYDDKTVEIEF